MEQVILKTFIFKFPTCTTNQEYELEIPIEVPYNGDVCELTERIITVFDIPVYAKHGINYQAMFFIFLLIIF